MLGLVGVVLALLAAGCGDDEAAAPAQVTPVPTTGAPVPSPTAAIHTSPTPTATEEGGDEAGIRVPVAIEVGREITVRPEVVAAFLPLGFTVRNTLDEDVTVVVMRADGAALARVEVPAGGTAEAEAEGQKAGTAEVLSPDLDPEATAILRIEPGG